MTSTTREMIAGMRDGNNSIEQKLTEVKTLEFCFYVIKIKKNDLRQQSNYLTEVQNQGKERYGFRE